MKEIFCASLFFVLVNISNAASTKLMCTPSHSNLVTSDGPVIVEFDEFVKTSFVNVPAIHFVNFEGVTGGYDGRGGSAPIKFSSVVSIFNPDGIIFQSGLSDYPCWSLNRFNGEFVGHTKKQCSYNDKSDAAVWTTFTCRPAKTIF